MHLERRIVSRKTPRDGKLEISSAVAARLDALAPDLQAEWQGACARAALVRMSCTCGSGETGHEHHFLESSVFRALPVGEKVDLALDAGTVRVAMTPST